MKTTVDFIVPSVDTVLHVAVIGAVAVMVGYVAFGADVAAVLA